MAAALVGGNAIGEEDPVIGDKPLSGWLKQLESTNRGLQIRAARALSEAPAELRGAIVPKLIPFLAAERENTRLPVAQIMGDYGSVARAATPHLLPLLEGTQFERNRAAAAKALGLIWKDAEPSEEVENVVRALIQCFPDKYSDVRRETVTACGMIGPAAKACVPDLVPRFSDTEWLKDAECFLVRRAAGWTTGRMKEHGNVHADRLISLMQGNNPVATEFVDALGELGPVHENVAPNIVDKLEKTIFGGYQGASGEQLMHYITSCLKALEKFGPKAAPAAGLMIRLLGPEDDVERNAWRTVGILKVLEATGPAAAQAVPVVEKNCLGSGNERIKKAAEAALVKIKNTPPQNDQKE
jgi:HEAT repeat protein